MLSSCVNQFAVIYCQKRKKLLKNSRPILLVFGEQAFKITSSALSFAQSKGTGKISIILLNKLFITISLLM